MIFPMSDNWWIEKNKAYFCGARISVLFCVDMNSLQCEVVSRLPECDIYDFRAHPYCIRYKDSIICLPGMGKIIWYYDMQKESWKKIEIEHEEQLIISMAVYKQNDSSRLWLLEYETGKIFQVNLGKGVLEKEYYIPQNAKEIIYYGEYVYVNNKLYTAVKKRVCCIDLENADIIIYEIDNLKAELYTICYDGDNFWLSGYCKEIYIWNPEQGIIKVITEFPEQFGIYHFYGKPYIDCNSFLLSVEEGPFFGFSILLGKYIWYIPNKSNGIIYIDKVTYKVSFLEIEEEKETKESLEREYANKFLFEYIREDRYIGLYSIKNQLVFEIDTLELCVKKKNYQLSNEAVSKIKKIIEDDNFQRILDEDIRKHNQRTILHESKKRERIIYAELIKRSNERDTKDFSGIGELIYSSLD